MAKVRGVSISGLALALTAVVSGTLSLNNGIFIFILYGLGKIKKFLNSRFPTGVIIDSG